MEGGSLAKFRVTKGIDFCYGHRLLNYEGKCRHLHGHNGRVEITIATDGLDERGIAFDFCEIQNRVKGWIDQNLDHKTLLNEKDPLLPMLQKMEEPVFVFKGNPTAENIAKLLFEKTLELGFSVEEVRLWETPDSCATYHG